MVLELMGFGRARAAMCAVWLGLGVSVAASAQAPAGEATTLRVNARLVVLDVTATDKSGKPITGLTADDFKVFEDNVPQRLRSFEPASAHQLPATVSEQGASAVFDPATPASFGATPVAVLVLDQLNTHFADSAYARRQLGNYLKSQPVVLAQPTHAVDALPGAFQGACRLYA